MNQLIASTARSLNLRLLIAILLGLFLVLGIQASDLAIDRDRSSVVASDAWPVRCSNKK